MKQSKKQKIINIISELEAMEFTGMEKAIHIKELERLRKSIGITGSYIDSQPIRANWLKLLVK